MGTRPSPLRARRLLRGLRLRDVSLATNLSDQAVSQVERGEATLRGRVLHTLASLYGTAADRLLLEHERWLRETASQRRWPTDMRLQATEREGER